MERIGFIGLGMMGSRMASRLLKVGYPVAVWNRTAEKAQPIDNQLKDLNNLMDLALRCQAPIPLGAAARELYLAARAQGKGGLDSAALVTVLEGLAGVTASGPTT